MTSRDSARSTSAIVGGALAGSKLAPFPGFSSAYRAVLKWVIGSEKSNLTQVICLLFQFGTENVISHVHSSILTMSALSLASRKALITSPQFSDILTVWLCPPSTTQMTEVPLFVGRGMSSGVQNFESGREFILMNVTVSLVSKQRITTILASGVWKARIWRWERNRVGDRRQCPVQILSLYKSVDIVEFLRLKITFGKLCF